MLMRKTLVFCFTAHLKSTIRLLVISGDTTFIIISFLYETYRKKINTEDTFYVQKGLFRQSELTGGFKLYYALYLVDNFETLVAYIINLGGADKLKCKRQFRVLTFLNTRLEKYSTSILECRRHRCHP